MSQQTPDEQLSYEQARTELVDVVQRLESGGVPLAESMTLWQRGEQLARICQGWLDGARATIERTRQAEAGSDEQEQPAPDAGAQG